MKEYHFILLTSACLFIAPLLCLNPSGGGWLLAIAIGLCLAVFVPAIYYPAKHRRRKAFSKMFDEEMERRKKQP